MKKLWRFIIGSPQTWRKVGIHADVRDAFEFTDAAWWLSDALWEKTGRPLYFCRYSIPGGTVARVEIAVEIEWTKEDFQTFFDEHPDKPFNVMVTDIQPCEGSLPHAQAWALASSLRGKGDKTIQDTLHWFFNMMGCSYADELRMLCEQSVTVATNLSQSEKRR